MGVLLVEPMRPGVLGRFFRVAKDELGGSFENGDRLDPAQTAN